MNILLFVSTSFFFPHIAQYHTDNKCYIEKNAYDFPSHFFIFLHVQANV